MDTALTDEIGIPVLVFLSPDEAQFLSMLAKVQRCEAKEVMRDLLRKKMGDGVLNCMECNDTFRPTRRNVTLCPRCMERRRALKCTGKGG